MPPESAPTSWLSILIPVYNVQAYLEACMHSVLSQVDAGVEVIVLDDVSTDNSLALLKQIQAQSPHPIRIIQHANNQGLSAARNSMLTEACGDYIWFLDSDDIICPGSLAELKNIIHSHKPDLVLCDFYMLRENTQLKHKLRGELHRKSFGGNEHQLSSDKNALFYNLYKTAQLHIWSKIAKRSLWGDDLRFPSGLLMEDQTVTPRLFLRANTYYYCPQVWVGYRQRPGSILSTPNRQRLIDSSISAKDVLKEWLQKHPNLTDQSRFTFAYTRAKLFVGISRVLRKNKQHDALAWHRQQFFDNSQCDLSWLMVQYLKRGWLLRLARLIYHLRT